MAVALALGSLLKGTKLAQAGIGLNLVKNQAEEIRALTLKEYGYDFVGLATYAGGMITFTYLGAT